MCEFYDLTNVTLSCVFLKLRRSISYTNVSTNQTLGQKNQNFPSPQRILNMVIEYMTTILARMIFCVMEKTEMFVRRGLGFQVKALPLNTG